MDPHKAVAKNPHKAGAKSPLMALANNPASSLRGVTILSKGGHGCVLRRAASCGETDELMSEEYIGKLIPKNDTAKREQKVMQWLQEIDLPSSCYVPIEDSCEIPQTALDKSQKDDCASIPSFRFPEDSQYKQLIYKNRGVDLFSDEIWRDPDIFPKLLAACQMLLAGLALVHVNGRAHCDIKPQNVLWHADDKILRLIDFGMMTTFKSQKFEKIEQEKDWEYHVFPPEVAATNASRQGYKGGALLRTACESYVNLMHCVRDVTGGNALAQVDTAPGLQAGPRYDTMKSLLADGTLMDTTDTVARMSKLDTYGFGGLLFFLTHVALHKKRARLGDPYIQALFPILDAFLNPDFRVRPDIHAACESIKDLNALTPKPESSVDAQLRELTAHRPAKPSPFAHLRHLFVPGSDHVSVRPTLARGASEDGIVAANPLPNVPSVRGPDKSKFSTSLQFRAERPESIEAAVAWRSSNPVSFGEPGATTSGFKYSGSSDDKRQPATQATAKGLREFERAGIFETAGPVPGPFKGPFGGSFGDPRGTASNFFHFDSSYAKEPKARDLGFSGRQPATEATADNLGVFGRQKKPEAKNPRDRRPHLAPSLETEHSEAATRVSLAFQEQVARKKQTSNLVFGRQKTPEAENPRDRRPRLAPSLQTEHSETATRVSLPFQKHGKKTTSNLEVFGRQKATQATQATGLKNDFEQITGGASGSPTAGGSNDFRRSDVPSLPPRGVMSASASSPELLPRVRLWRLLMARKCAASLCQPHYSWSSDERYPHKEGAMLYPPPVSVITEQWLVSIRASDAYRTYMDSTNDWYVVMGDAWTLACAETRESPYSSDYDKAGEELHIWVRDALGSLNPASMDVGCNFGSASASAIQFNPAVATVDCVVTDKKNKLHLVQMQTELQNNTDLDRALKLLIGVARAASEDVASVGVLYLSDGAFYTKILN